MTPRTVLVAPGLLDEFVRGAIRAYEECTPALPPRHWAVLLGRFANDAMVVDAVRQARNVRETDAHVLAEFEAGIVPRFGAAYANVCRGFWCDARHLLGIMAEARATGQEVLGSIHLHPDWHRIGPAHEQGLVVSESPTPMDEYVFGHTGYPLNMILYLERRHGAVHGSLGAWAPPLTDAHGPAPGCSPVAIRYRLTGPADAPRHGP